MVEEAAQALTVAARTGINNAVVLHIDNSDDLWPVPTANQVEKAKLLLKRRDFEALEISGRVLTPGTERLYSYINHLVMAHRLGIVKEVYWAVPSLDAFDVDDLQAIMNYPVNRSNPFAANTGTKLQIELPYIKGTISDVPVTIGLLKHFQKSKSPVWVDIELDYFAELHKNPVSSSYLGLLSGFVKAYEKLGIDPHLLTITFGNTDGQLGLSERFLGLWLQELLANPQMIQDEPPALWTLKEEALYQDFFIQPDEALTVYGEILKQDNDNADAHNSLGTLLIELGHHEQALRSLKRAAKIDTAYEIGYLEALRELTEIKEVDVKSRFIQALIDSTYPAPDLLRNAALERQEAGKYQQAIKLIKELIDAGDDSPLTLAMLGDIYLRTNKLDKAVDSFNQAMKSLRLHSQTHQLPLLWVKLAHAYEETGQLQAARKTYREYLDFFPIDDSNRRESATLKLKELESDLTKEQ